MVNLLETMNKDLSAFMMNGKISDQKTMSHWFFNSGSKHIYYYLVHALHVRGSLNPFMKFWNDRDDWSINGSINITSMLKPNTYIHLQTQFNMHACCVLIVKTNSLYNIDWKLIKKVNATVCKQVKCEFPSYSYKKEWCGYLISEYPCG